MLQSNKICASKLNSVMNILSSDALFKNHFINDSKINNYAVFLFDKVHEKLANNEAMDDCLSLLHTLERMHKIISDKPSYEEKLTSILGNITK